MQTKVYNNVEGHRVIDNDKVCEDITSVTLPTVKHSSSSMDAGGMIMAVDMPNTTHLDAMEFSVAHNNGTNCQYLQTPGKHSIEVRVVRQKYDVQKAEMLHESVKYRVIGVHASTDKGDVKTDNPLGYTEKYSVLRYEEIINGTTTMLIDAMNGIIKYNGQDYASAVENLLK